MGAIICATVASPAPLARLEAVAKGRDSVAFSPLGEGREEEIAGLLRCARNDESFVIASAARQSSNCSAPFATASKRRKE